MEKGDNITNSQMVYQTFLRSISQKAFYKRKFKILFFMIVFIVKYVILIYLFIYEEAHIKRKRIWHLHLVEKRSMMTIC